MSKKNNNEEPWSRRFGEDENFNNRKYSRSARKSTNQEVAPLYKVLLFLFLALLIIPFATYYWSEKSRTTPDPQTPEQVMVNKQISESEPESSSSEIESFQAEKSEEESANSSSSESTQSEETESSSSSQESVESKPSESTEEPESVPQSDDEYKNTYVVQTGDNLYRIALNHGMDLDVLKSINGIYTDSIEVGSVLKVK